MRGGEEGGSGVIGGEGGGREWCERGGEEGGSGVIGGDGRREGGGKEWCVMRLGMMTRRGKEGGDKDGGWGWKEETKAASKV